MGISEGFSDIFFLMRISFIGMCLQLVSMAGL